MRRRFSEFRADINHDIEISKSGARSCSKTSSPGRMKENRKLLALTLVKGDIALLDGMTTEADVANRSARKDEED